MKRNRGFSLVEVVITLAIMACLVGFVAPQFLKYWERSKDSRTMQIGDAYREAVEVTITATAGGTDHGNVAPALSNGYLAFSSQNSIPANYMGAVVQEVASAMHATEDTKFEAIAIIENYQVTQVTIYDLNTGKVLVWFQGTPHGSGLSGMSASNEWIVIDSPGGSWASDYAGISSVSWNGN